MFDFIYLTGFKKFGGHEVNPTEEVVKAIEAQNVPRVRCSVVEVTTVDVDNYIAKTLEEVEGKKDEKILHLHFGVGPNMVYRLETTAYNNKDFSIPDNIGYKPSKEQIT
jgi:pyroglutamyl-peptidase